MAQKSGFFTSSSGDRKYGSDWLAQYIAAIISNGVYTTELTVSGGNGNMSVTVGAGRAWINGYMYSNDSNMTLALSAADGALSRTDLIVLRLDMTNRQITLAVMQGDFGGGVPVLTRTSDIYELCLAQISVVAGTTQITAQMITDTRADETVCGIVAGAVTQLSTGELLNQLKAGFEEWFNGIKGQLSEDAAGNLQNQINDIPKLITPAINMGWEKIQEYLVAGAYTWTAPDLFNGADYLIGVYIIGGGGSGAGIRMRTTASYACSAVGGASGKARAILMTVTPGAEYPLVIGAGGDLVAIDATHNMLNGINGGSTSFNGISTDGGNGGKYHQSSGTTTFREGADGGQGSDAVYNAYFPDTAPAMGGNTWDATETTSGPYVGGRCELAAALNPFDLKRYLGAGGNAYGIYSGNYKAQQTPILDDGNSAGAGYALYTTADVGDLSAENATGAGNGGGAIAVFMNSSSAAYGTFTSGAGADGMVSIYVKGASE